MKPSTSYSVENRKDTEKFTDRWQCRTKATLVTSGMEIDVVIRTAKLMDGELGTFVIAETKTKNHDFLWSKEPCLRADLRVVQAAHNRVLLVRDTIYETVIENFLEK